MTRRINISEEVWAEIAKRGKFGETEDTVLRQVFGLDVVPSSNSRRSRGAAAAAWGRSTANAIADRMGAKSVNPNGNEYELNGERVTIRCARRRTNSVGVTYKMLERVNVVLAALESTEGEFEIFRLDPSKYSAAMRKTGSRGPSAGRVGIVPTRVFREQGRSLGRISLQETGR